MIVGDGNSEGVIAKLSRVVERLNQDLNLVIRTVIEVQDTVKQLEATNHSMSPQLSPIKAGLKQCMDQVAEFAGAQTKMKQSVESSQNDIKSLSEKVNDVTQSLPQLKTQVDALGDKISQVETNSENNFQSLSKKVDDDISPDLQNLQTKVESIDQVLNPTRSTPTNQLLDSSIEEKPAPKATENADVHLNKEQDNSLLKELRDLIDSFLEEVQSSTQPIQRLSRSRSRSYSSGSEYKSFQSQISMESSSQAGARDSAVFSIASPISSEADFDVLKSPTAANVPGIASTSTPLYNKHDSYHSGDKDHFFKFLTKIRTFISDKLVECQ